jgi:putative SOS response-associated peptidase YedK
MCGRFTLRSNPRQIALAFDLTEVPELPPRWNISPTQEIAVVRAAPGGGRQLVFCRWGLVPSWADDPKIGNRMINARAETVAEKPSFRTPLARRRCLIVADGFYEWQKTPDGKQPHYITLAEDGPFALAGLWEHWRRGETAFDSATIITTEANELLRPIHDRMPVIVPREEYGLWLDERVDRAEGVTPLLRSYPASAMRARPVAKPGPVAPTHE